MSSSTLSGENAPQFFANMLKNHAVVLISASHCSYSGRIKAMFMELGQAFITLEVNFIPNGREVMAEVVMRTKMETVPQVFIRGKFVGGYDEVMRLHKEDKLMRLIGASGATRR